MKPKDPGKELLLFDATLRLVRENGLAGVTMAGIARAAGLGMGTVYTYFKSKEELINALYCRVKQQNAERIMAVADGKEPFAVLLKKIWLSYIQNRIRYHDEHFFIDQCMNSHFLDEASKRAARATYASFHQLLEAGKQQMLIKDLDNEVLTAHLMGSVNELANLVLYGGYRLTESFAAEGFRLCWDSLKR